MKNQHLEVRLYLSATRGLVQRREASPPRFIYRRPAPQQECYDIDMTLRRRSGQCRADGIEQADTEYEHERAMCQRKGREGCSMASFECVSYDT